MKYRKDISDGEGFIKSSCLNIAGDIMDMRELYS